MLCYDINREKHDVILHIFPDFLIIICCFFITNIGILSPNIVIYTFSYIFDRILLNSLFIIVMLSILFSHTQR